MKNKVNSAVRTHLTAVCCMILVLLTAGCAALTSTAVKQETLEERVQNYMKAQIDRNWDQAYSFLNASSREKTPKSKFLQQHDGKLSYKKFEIEGITLLPSGDEATVKVLIDLSFMGYVFPRAPRTQEWVKENGAWFIKSPNKTTPFASPKKKQ